MKIAESWVAHPFAPPPSPRGAVAAGRVQVVIPVDGPDISAEWLNQSVGRLWSSEWLNHLGWAAE
jgi:hypothetical protein